ncbi:MAG: NAD(+)/NADH kinase [Clostridiales bacterium]|nr:NAD(+)/NADH kinase [Clostridiales bacterium]
MKFSILPNLTKEDALSITLEVCRRLDQLKCIYFISNAYKSNFVSTKAVFVNENELLNACDAVITVGGDGTILRAAKSAAKLGKAVLGINAGRLAFMAGMEKHELSMLNRLIDKSFTIDKRTMLNVRVELDNKILFEDNCINDVVFSRLGAMRIIDILVKCDFKPINIFRGDGIIVSTPTGSTAYSLSAGGPVVDPEINCMILTPICTHSLFSRSLIFKEDKKLTVTAENDSELALSCDGGALIIIPEGASAQICTSKLTADFIRIKSDSFIDVLNSKLTQRRV